MLELRAKLRKAYGQAIKNRISTLTFAPARSYKTESIRLACSEFGQASVFDMRETPSPKEKTWVETTISLIKSQAAANVFLDSIDIVPLETLKSLIISLQSTLTVHIIGHLYFYDTTRQLNALFKEKIEFFPQLLSQSDLQLIENYLFSGNEQADLIVHKLIELAEGWPGVIYGIEHEAVKNKLLSVIRTYAPKVRNEKEAESFALLIYKYVYHNIFEELKQFVFPKARAFAVELGENKINLSISGQKNLPDLVKEKNPAAWEAMKAGLLWFNEEASSLLIPKILLHLDEL